MNKISFTAVAAARCNLLVALISTLAFSSCATSNSPSWPVQAVSGETGAVSSVRTYEQNGRVMVVGSARPTFCNSVNHVDIELVGADGRVVARKTERIKLGHPRGSQARHRSDSFAVSFPTEASQQTASVRVSFHGGAHSRCAGEQS